MVDFGNHESIPPAGERRLYAVVVAKRTTKVILIGTAPVPLRSTPGAPQSASAAPPPLPCYQTAATGLESATISKPRRKPLVEESHIDTAFTYAMPHSTIYAFILSGLYDDDQLGGKYSHLLRNL